jgi:hypothetical protein
MTSSLFLFGGLVPELPARQTNQQAIQKSTFEIPFI